MSSQALLVILDSRISRVRLAIIAFLATTVGISAIRMDANNLGSTDLELRLAIDGAGGRFVSTTGVALTVGSGWINVLFPVTAADFSAVGGFDIDATFSSFAELRILSNSSPSFGSEIIVATLGIDNISAIPMVLYLMISGLAS